MRHPAPLAPRLRTFGLVLAAASATAVASPAVAQSGGDGGWTAGVELKAHFRSSDSERFPSPFPFLDEQLPPDAMQGFMETVDAGDHFEVSNVGLWGEAAWGERWSGRIRLDFIDRYDRNPTSTGADFDVDEAWLRYGVEVEPAAEAEGYGFYAKLGKYGPFERQDDRHLESYGLVSTAFNRFEDVGLELGFDLGRRLYLKASYTHGNPVFIRDPNALAGDNGTPTFDGSVPNPVSELKTGIPIFYDTDVDEIDFAHPEVGLGVGWRREGRFAVDVLAWVRERELASTVDLWHTFYDGDLDLLLGPGNATPLPVSGDEKEEVGANLWVYAGGFSGFAQVVDQELAGLDRLGYEVELAWAFDLPLVWAVGGRQLFSFVAPAVRWSELDPDFVIHPRYPARSVVWDWRKLDAGLRLGVWDGVDLTAEYQDNAFVRGVRTESNDELLLTLRVRVERGPGAPAR